MENLCIPFAWKQYNNQGALPCLFSRMFFWRRRICRRSSISSVWFI